MDYTTIAGRCASLGGNLHGYCDPDPDDRVVLVGDAAGCMSLLSGQGANMAMGSAYVLAEELGYNDEYRDAFAFYEHRVRPHVELRQQKAHDLAKSLVPGSRVGLEVQKVLMKILLLGRD